MTGSRYCGEVSNTDTAPAEVACAASAFAGVLHPREVPLGGPRAIRVRRTLPQRERSLIGAWCFADHYGPHDVGDGIGMDVPPHPHTGLQTVSWLFEGEIEHRDSAGVHAIVRPGEVNLMTAGAGICHSEVSTAATTVLHGVQLWVALPDVRPRHRPRLRPSRARARRRSQARCCGCSSASLRVADHRCTPSHRCSGRRSIWILARGWISTSTRPSSTACCWTGASLVAAGSALDVADLAYQPTGCDTLPLHNPGDEPARAILLGGQPFGEELVMWWNFVGRSHDDIATYRRQWQERDARFGSVTGTQGSVTRLPAPPLPNATLRPRPNPKGAIHEPNR